MTDLLLTGRPVSRTTSRKYEQHDDPFSSRSKRQQSPNEWAHIEDADQFEDSSSYTEPMTSSYQTVPSTFMFNRRPDHKQESKLDNSARSQVSSMTVTPQVTMSRTKNKYRLRTHKPSECDDTLFGRPSTADYKAWKAPWNHSKAGAPLLFDSTDRTGHYSPEKTDRMSARQRSSAKSDQRRAWR